MTSGIASWLVSLMTVAKVAPNKNKASVNGASLCLTGGMGRRQSLLSTRIPSLLSLKLGQSQINKIKKQFVMRLNYIFFGRKFNKLGTGMFALK